MVHIIPWHSCEHAVAGLHAYHSSGLSQIGFCQLHSRVAPRVNMKASVGMVSSELVPALFSSGFWQLLSDTDQLSPPLLAFLIHLHCFLGSYTEPSQLSFI